LTMSHVVRYPYAYASAFGGVPIGVMKASEQATVAGTIKNSGFWFTAGDSASVANTGRRILGVS
jgi:hypothetical protein